MVKSDHPGPVTGPRSLRYDWVTLASNFGYVCAHQPSEVFGTKKKVTDFEKR